MTLRDFYALIQSDYDETLRRLGNEERLRKFLLKFAEDLSFEQLGAALSEENYEDAFRFAHTLKGIALNLGFNKLSDKSSALTEALRSRAVRADFETLYRATEAEYRVTVDAIRNL